MRTTFSQRQFALIIAALIGGAVAVAGAVFFQALSCQAGVPVAPALSSAASFAASSASTSDTVTAPSSVSQLAARLRAHVRALAPARADAQARALAAAPAPDFASMAASMRRTDAWPTADTEARAVNTAAATDRPTTIARYIAATLRAEGYAVQRNGGDEEGDPAGATIEASLSNPAPGMRPARIFVIGVHYGEAVPGDDPSGDAAGVAAVLELARLLRTVHPSRGTEIRFVFIEGRGSPVDDGFVAFAGTSAAVRRVRQALAAFQDAADDATRGLAAHAYGQGDVLSAAPGEGDGDGPALLVTGTDFLRYPYRATGPIADDALRDDDDDDDDASPDYAALARVLTGLARTIDALAADRRS